MREAEARGRHDTHNLKISFDHRRHGQPFDLTPDGLRNALAIACGPDPATYVQEKLRQLHELGYEDARIVGNALFRVESEDHLSRVLLGVEPLRPVRLETFDTRFGIPIPYASDLFSELEEIMVEPPSAGVCVIAITGPPLAPAAIFRTEMLFAPPFDGELRMLLRHPDISVRFKETDVAYEAECVFTDRARSLADMVTLLRALTYLGSGKAIMSLTGEGGSFGPIRQPLSTPLTGPYLEDLPALARLASDWQSLLELAGISSQAELTMDDLWSAHRAALAADLLLHTDKKAGFAFDRNELVGIADSVKAIYFDSCQIAGEGISYSVEVTLEATEAQPDVFRSVEFNPIEVRPKVADLNDYMDDLADRFGPGVMIHPDHVRRVDPSELEVPDVRVREA
ncbi:hypothetical protein [Flavisphingomonas formosensis]|uniref:hypothetical protein n=1 Tax=Flavisphingomonas formosensis TaxID=861534 RepID=UPI0012F8BF65|nr:hypothetical protein [Sphingomonas formosensis]